MAIPLSATGSLTPTFVSARLVGLAVKHSIYLYALRVIANHTESTFERLRYFLGGDRPSQTAKLALSFVLIQGSKLEF
jgi:hypothetical protein